MSEKRAFTAIAADVRSAQNGDGEAMNRILADVQDMVYYNCLKMLRDEQAAQDTTQEILIAVYQKLGALSDPQAYVGWVKRIKANLCKNRLCKVNREFLLSVNEDGEDPFADFEDTDEQRIPDKALDNEETRRMIADLVDRLPDEQRMCVDGVCYTDWSKWYSEAEAAPYELRDYHFFYTGDLSDCAYAWTFKPDWELEERTFYRYRRR